jgi:hypothetical protein
MTEPDIAEIAARISSAPDTLAPDTQLVLLDEAGVMLTWGDVRALAAACAATRSTEDTACGQ